MCCGMPLSGVAVKPSGGFREEVKARRTRPRTHLSPPRALQVRDLYWTFRNFRNRVADFLRYRRVTANMDERFPDATAAQLERGDHTCIVCREDMVAGGRNKVLPCGHVFHLHCLRCAAAATPRAGTAARLLMLCRTPSRGTTLPRGLQEARLCDMKSFSPQSAAEGCGTGFIDLVGKLPIASCHRHVAQETDN